MAATPRHLDRLSGVDASFLLQEGASTHMHIGAVATFDGPPPTYAEFLAHIGSRLGSVPRYRQKIVDPPLGTGRPVWVDDPSFNLAYHVRHTAMPRPGGEEQLVALASRIFSQRLDRTKPLWELWLVEGHEGGRFALINKVHHCLVDGVAGVDLMSVLFDLEPVPRPAYIADPVARLHYIRETMAALKEAKQPVGAAALVALEDFSPPTLLAQASRLHFSSRMYTLLVTNVPGPQIPLYVLGREMQEVIPVPFLGGRRALAVAIMSYNGGVPFGLLGGYDSPPDLDVLAEALSESLG